MKYAGAKQLTHKAKEFLFQTILCFLKIIKKHIYMEFYYNKRVSIENIKYIFSNIFQGKILSIVSNLTLQKSIFSVKLFKSFLDFDNFKINKKCVQYICLAMEYFIYDIVDSANSVCVENNRIRISYDDITTAIDGDIETYLIFSKNNVKIIQNKRLIKRREFHNMVQGYLDNKKISKEVSFLLQLYYENVISNIIYLSYLNSRTNMKKIVKTNHLLFVLKMLYPNRMLRIIDDEVEYDEEYEKIENMYDTLDIENIVNNNISNVFEDNYVVDVQTI